jgi:CHAT domain-containing protein
VPHLVLVPLGELGAIPYAAAWTSDPAMRGGRRYAVDDLLLTHAVSARLLAEVARRPRLPLHERVVLVTDPTGEFPYARATAHSLADTLYPSATVYGRGRHAEGPAATANLLAALPGTDSPGASLLHLSTHATTVPVPRLQTADGWLPRARILAQARGRPPHVAGGIVVTNACLTDSTSAHYDESVTLATALLAAGATGVIGTRWPIDDDTSSTLTHCLHHHLAAGHPPAAALRLAQLDLLGDGPPRPPGLHPHLAALGRARLAHPASWSGYVHHGR